VVFCLVGRLQASALRGAANAAAFGLAGDLIKISEIPIQDCSIDESTEAISRYPDGAQSTLAVTGDIDAFALWDYGLRLGNR
jgi:hypothetical protein